MHSFFFKWRHKKSLSVILCLVGWCVQGWLWMCRRSSWALSLRSALVSDWSVDKERCSCSRLFTDTQSHCWLSDEIIYNTEVMLNWMFSPCFACNIYSKTDQSYQHKYLYLIFKPRRLLICLLDKKRFVNDYINLDISKFWTFTKKVSVTHIRSNAKS